MSITFTIVKDPWIVSRPWRVDADLGNGVVLRRFTFKTKTKLLEHLKDWPDATVIDWNGKVLR